MVSETIRHLLETGVFIVRVHPRKAVSRLRLIAKMSDLNRTSHQNKRRASVRHDGNINFHRGIKTLQYEPVPDGYEKESMQHWFLKICGRNPKTCNLRRDDKPCEHPTADCLMYEKLQDEGRPIKREEGEHDVYPR